MSWLRLASAILGLQFAVFTCQRLGLAAYYRLKTRYLSRIAYGELGLERAGATSRTGPSARHSV